MNRTEQLTLENQQLRLALERALHAYSVRDAGGCIDGRGLIAAAEDAMKEANRIAAAPVEETDAEVVDEWLSGDDRDLILDDEFGDWEWFKSISKAAAWVRAQKEVSDGD